MPKVIVVYESKYGNTKLAAEKIAAGIKKVSGVDVALNEVKELVPNRLVDFDAIVVGSPNHMGGATRNIGGLVNKLADLKLDGKLIAVFDTCAENDYQKVVKKLEKMISQKAPNIKLFTPGLSIKISGMKGPISQDELNKCETFGSQFANQIKK
jgi:flavorubredoxin